MVHLINKIPEDYKPRIWYVGVFDYQKLIKTFATWFANMGYEFHENVYKHKVPSPAGSEQEFKFSGWRKVTEYTQFWIRIHGHIWEIKEIEVLVDGKKKKMAKGKIMINLTSEVWLDYNNKFTSPAAVTLQKFLHKYVWRKQIESGWEDEAYYRMYKLHLEIKKSLNMSTATNASQLRY